ncbi:hypothetical protein HS7_14130 [Sulfolobales archaeon HS-7]|nr:hypothetical protein HS7_14130 [Sulfolobales archaeon HS-7]
MEKYLDKLMKFWYAIDYENKVVYYEREARAEVERLNVVKSGFRMEEGISVDDEQEVLNSQKSQNNPTEIVVELINNAIFIPKSVAEKLNLKEKDKLILILRDDNKIELVPLRKASKYWAEIDPDEVVGEQISNNLGIDS